MSIISILSPNRKQLIASKPLLNILHQIKSGLYSEEIGKLREAFESNVETPEAIENDIIPWFSISGHFKQRQKSLELVSYSSYMIFEIIYLNETDQAGFKEALIESPFIYALFKNTVGTGLNFIVATDSKFPNHQSNFWKVKSYFQEYLKINRISIKGEVLDYFCRFSWDTELYMNLDADVFSIKD